MPWLDLFLVGSASVYVVAVVCLAIGRTRLGTDISQAFPSASIIVAARNEASMIDACLKALAAQDYAGRFEIIVVDDRSDDDTGLLVRQSGLDVRLIRMDQGEGVFRCPKKNALTRGIEASSGELLLFTDADCRPSKAWVASMVARFHDRVGLVAGYAFDNVPQTGLGRLLSVDNLAVSALASGSFGLKHPLACTGRNLAYRRSVYDEVGGFTTIGHLVGGDDVYFARLVAARTDWALMFNESREAAVSCEPRIESWSAVLHRKLRHASKAAHYGGGALLLGAVVYLFHLFVAMGLVRAFSEGNGLLLAAVLGSKMLADLALVWPVSGHLEARNLLIYLPILQIAYIPYVLVFTIVGRLGWFRWK